MRGVLVRTLVAVFAAALMGAAVLAWSGYRFLHRIQTPAAEPASALGTPRRGPAAAPRPGPAAAPRPAPPRGAGLTVLLVGIDARRNEASRADAIVLVHLDEAGRRAAVVSIPRDSRVTIPGRGPDKINHAYAYGGPRLLRQTIEAFLGIEVDRYVRVNFRGFRRAIDLLGGVEVDVDRPMEEVFVGVLDEPVKRVRLEPGRQVLRGDEATLFIHFRHGRDGDIGRARRHQQVLAAVWRRLLEPSSVWKVPAILDELGGSIRTDLSPAEIFRLARLGRTISEARVTWRVLDGRSQTIGGISYWIPDPETVRQAARQLGGEP